MLEIYLDEVLLDNEYYAGLSNNFKLFNESFSLGTTTANSFSLDISAKAISTIPKEVKIKIDGSDYANLIVDSYNYKDENFITLNLVDKMVLFDFNYDASSIVPCSVKNILKDICSKIDVELGNENFTNEDLIVNYYDNTITAREYVGYIAELNGGYAKIGKDGKLYLKKFINTEKEIDLKTSKSYKIGEKHKVERVVFDNGLLKYETSDDETLETLYLNSENVYINSEEIFNNIANEILNFEFYNISTGYCKINSDVEVGDVVNFVVDEIKYPSIAQVSLNFNGGWVGNYEFNVQSKQQQETEIVGVEQKVKSIKVQQDRDNATIKILVEEAEDITNEINKTNTDVNNNYQDLLNKLNDCAKEDDIVDLKKSVDTLQSSTDYTITVLEDIQVNGVSKVETETGYVFDKEGLSIDKTDAPTGGKFNEAGMEIVDKLTAALTTLFYSGYVNEEMAQKVDALTKYMGQTVTYTNSLIFQKYLSSMNMRLEDIEHDVFGKGLGFFTIGDDE